MRTFHYNIYYKLPDNVLVKFAESAPTDHQAVELALDKAILILDDESYMRCETQAPEIICTGYSDSFNATRMALEAFDRIRMQIERDAANASNALASATFRAVFSHLDRIQQAMDETSLWFSIHRVSLDMLEDVDAYKMQASTFRSIKRA